MQKANVLFDYKAAEGTVGHLTLSRGDMVLVDRSKQQFDEWWTGSSVLTGANGMFPSSYVAMIDESNAFSATGLYDFAGEHDGTVPFKKGDKLTVVKAEEGGWWQGYVDGKYGLFPEPYVKRDDDAAGGAAAPRGKAGTFSGSRDASAAGASPDSNRRDTLKTGRSKKKSSRRFTDSPTPKDGSSAPPSRNSSDVSSSELEELASELKKREADVKKRETELKRHERDVNALEGELKQREKEVSVSETALKKKEVRCKRKESELSERKRALEKLEVSLEHRKDKLAALEDEVSKRESKAKKRESEAREKKREADKKLLNVEKQARDLKRREKELAFQLKELKRREEDTREASQSKDDAREDALKRLEMRCVEQAQDVARLQSELNDKEYRLQAREAELAEMERELREEQTKLQARIAAARSSSSAPQRAGAAGKGSHSPSLRRNQTNAAPLAAVKLDKNLSPSQRKLALRQTVIEEIVSTEADYVQDLELLVQDCLSPARLVLAPADIEQVFSNVEEIWRLNSRVLSQLRERNDPANPKAGELGEVFIDLAGVLRKYADYCANQDTSVAAYLRLKDTQSTVMFLDDLEKDMGGHDLCSYLIKPVQRLCKYPLLLRELLKYTNEAHKDYAKLKKAEKLVQESVQHVNDHQKLLESKARLEELKSAFVGVPADLQLDKFLLENNVMELIDAASGEREPRQLFLFADTLLVAKPQTRSKLLAYKTHFPLRSLRVKGVPPSPHMSNGVLLENTASRAGAMMIDCKNAFELKKFQEACEKAQASASLQAPAPVAAGALAAVKSARGPDKPVLKANATPAEYKAFMRAKYEYEQWENEQLRKKAARAKELADSPPPPRRGASLNTAVRLPSVVPPPIGPPPAVADAPAPAEPPREPKESKKLCRKCGLRKVFAKVTLEDGSVVKVCEVCVAEYSAAQGSLPPPPLPGPDSGAAAPPALPPLEPASKAMSSPKSRRAGTLKRRSSRVHSGRSSPAPKTEAALPPPPTTAPVVPLLPGWYETKADDGRVYYYNDAGETTWERPAQKPAAPPALPSMVPPPIV